MQFVNNQGPFQPTQTSFQRIVLNDDITLEWPFSFVPSNTVVANVIEVALVTATGLTITLPDATETSVGSSFIIVSLDTTNSFNLLDNGGNFLLSIPHTPDISAVQNSFMFVLTRNDNNLGTWLQLGLGVTTASYDVQLIAGYGLQAAAGAQGPTQICLNTITASQELDTGPTYDVAATDQSSLLYVTNVTTVALNTNTLPVGFYVYIQNGAEFLVSITADGGTVNGATSFSMNPSDSFMFVNIAANTWIVVGNNGINPNEFTEVVINVNSLSSPYTLTADQYGANGIVFTGTLTGLLEIYFPTIASLWTIKNNVDTSSNNLTLVQYNGEATVGTTYFLVKDDVLQFMGTAGGLSRVPTWGKGLPVNQGGTGVKTLPVNTLLAGNAIDPVQTVAAPSAIGQTLSTLGTGTLPVWLGSAILGFSNALNNTPAGGASTQTISLAAYRPTGAGSRMLLVGNICWGAANSLGAVSGTGSVVINQQTVPTASALIEYLSLPVTAVQSTAFCWVDPNESYVPDDELNYVVTINAQGSDLVYLNQSGDGAQTPYTSNITLIELGGFA